MSVPAFPPKVVFEYAFSCCDNLPDAPTLSKDAIGKFICVLCSDIMSDSERPALMRHIWVMGQTEEQGFLREQRRFIDLGDCVSCCRIPSADDARQIERRYEDAYGCDTITRALRHARSVARNEGSES